MKKYLFTHNPKTGGSTLHNLLPNNDWHNLDGPISIREMTTEQIQASVKLAYESKPHHYTINQHKKVGTFSDDELEQAFKFTFVRNPFDRLVSEYHMIIENSNFGEHAIYTDGFELSFETFLKHAKRVVNFGTYFMWNPGPFRGVHPNHLTPQNLYVFDQEEKIVDYAARFENFEEDIINILEAIGLEVPKEIPRIGASSSRKNYREYYDDETIKMVEKIYEKDLNLFGYEY
jgi:chondroitin 4-sulfotransferase 11